MATISFTNVTKTFGKTEVIRPLNLEIGQGEFFTFVGPSGCGKSTILHLIAGLESPSTGSILFDNVRVDGLDPGQRDVALVFQNYALYPHMTVFENLAFPLRMRKQSGSKVESEVRRVAELLDISGLLLRRPRDLSGGQRQRVALGRAIVRRPKVFLLDEPLSNLDARLRAEMRAELKRLHADLGITTVYVTHDQSEAMGLSDRVAVLNQGKVEQCNAPLDVYSRPENTFVAGFIGIPAMNILPAVVESEQPLRLSINGFPIDLSLRGRLGRQSVLAGIRPEHLIAERGSKPGAAEMKVLVSEPMGAVTWLELDFRGRRVRAAEKPGEGLRAGELCSIIVPAGQVVLFDKDTGARLA